MSRAADTNRTTYTFDLAVGIWAITSSLAGRIRSSAVNFAKVLFDMSVARLSELSTTVCAAESGDRHAVNAQFPGNSPRRPAALT
jgi:hypothetical protein